MSVLLFVCFILSSVFCVCLLFCFFQAEDGIRDLVRSRGLGDVYKRQERSGSFELGLGGIVMRGRCWELTIIVLLVCGAVRAEPVSYTHLTLPTSDLV